MQLPSEHELSDVAGIPERSSGCFPPVEQKLFCSAHLQLKFKRFASGSHSPSKETPESFVLCVREEMAGEVLVKI